MGKRFGFHFLVWLSNAVLTEQAEKVGGQGLPHPPFPPAPLPTQDSNSRRAVCMPGASIQTAWRGIFLAWLFVVGVGVRRAWRSLGVTGVGQAGVSFCWCVKPPSSCLPPAMWPSSCLLPYMDLLLNLCYLSVIILSVCGIPSLPFLFCAPLDSQVLDKGGGRNNYYKSGGGSARIRLAFIFIHRVPTVLPTCFSPPPPFTVP